MKCFCTFAQRVLIALATLWAFQISAMGAETDFIHHVQPILRAQCVACHNAQKAEGGLNLESLSLLVRGGDSGAGIVAGQGSTSELIKRVLATDDSKMPPDKNNVGARSLTADEIQLLQTWIDAGAPEGTAAPSSSMQWRALPDTVRPMYAMDATNDAQFVAAGRANQAIVYRWPINDGVADMALLVDPQVQAELKTSQPVADLDLIQSVAINGDGTRMATGGYRDVKIWRRSAGAIDDGIVAMLRGSKLVTTSPDRWRIARATFAPAVEIIDARTSKTTHRIAGTSLASSVVWQSDNQGLTVVGQDSLVHHFVIAPTESQDTMELKPVWSAKIEQPLQDGLWLTTDLLVGRTNDRRVQCWQLADGGDGMPKTLTKLERWADLSDVVALGRFDEAGQPRLAVAASDGTVRVYSGPEGMLLRSISHGGTIHHMAVSGDSTKLVSVGADGAIKAWNALDGALLWEQKNDIEFERSTERAERLAARQKSKVDRATARVPELEKAKQAEMDAQGKLQTARQQITEDLTKKQGELESQDKSVVEGEAAMATAKAAVDEAMKRLEATQKDLEERKKKQQAALKAKQEVEMKLQTMDKTIAGATQAIEKATNLLAQFQVTLENEKRSLGELEQAAAQIKAQQPAIPATRALFTADHRAVVTSHADGSMRWMRADKGTSQSVYRGGFATYVGVALTPDGRLYAATDDGRAVGWIDSNRWVLERSIGSPTESPFSDRVTALDFSDDGQFLVAGSGAPSRFGELKLLRVSDGSVVKDWGQVHSDSTLVARFSPDGSMVVTGAADKLVRIHSVSTDTPARTLEGHTHHVLGAVWHDDGHWIASSSADNTVKLWDVETGTTIRTIPGFGKEVTSLAFVGRTTQILSTSADQQTRLHEATNGNLIRAMGGPSDALYCVVATGRTPVALAGGQEGVLWIWQIDNGQPIQQLK